MPRCTLSDNLWFSYRRRTSGWIPYWNVFIKYLTVSSRRFPDLILRAPEHTDYCLLLILIRRHQTACSHSDGEDGSGICLLFISALMECEYWLMGNPDTDVAIRSSESRLAGYYSLWGGISARTRHHSPSPGAAGTMSLQPCYFVSFGLRIKRHESNRVVLRDFRSGVGGFWPAAWVVQCGGFVLASYVIKVGC